MRMGDGDGQGDLACCDSWGCRVRHDWATELNAYVPRLLSVSRPLLPPCVHRSVIYVCVSTAAKTQALCIRDSDATVSWLTHKVNMQARLHDRSTGTGAWKLRWAVCPAMTAPAHPRLHRPAPRSRTGRLPRADSGFMCWLDVRFTHLIFLGPFKTYEAICLCWLKKKGKKKKDLGWIHPAA